MAIKKPAKNIMLEDNDIIIEDENDDVILVSEDTIQKVKDEAKIDVVIIEEIESTPLARMVKIKMKEYHRCCIGGNWYELLDGKQYNVPENVKEILLNANKLLPL